MDLTVDTSEEENSVSIAIKSNTIIRGVISNLY